MGVLLIREGDYVFEGNWSFDYDDDATKKNATLDIKSIFHEDAPRVTDGIVRGALNYCMALTRLHSVNLRMP